MARKLTPEQIEDLKRRDRKEWQVGDKFAVLGGRAPGSILVISSIQQDRAILDYPDGKNQELVPLSHLGSFPGGFFPEVAADYL